MRTALLKIAGLGLAAILLLSGCGKPEPVTAEDHPPHASVQIKLRVVSQHGTPSLEFNGRKVAVREPPLFTNADIQNVAASFDGNGVSVISMTFKPESVPRILRATEAAVGKEVVLSANDQALTLAHVAGAFGQSMQVTLPGKEPEQVQAFARYLTEGGEPVTL